MQRYDFFCGYANVFNDFAEIRKFILLKYTEIRKFILLKYAEIRKS